MRVVAVCCTYNRPHLLPFLLWCFERQTHADRGLLIYDDHGQYEDQEGPGWKLVSERSPARSLGEKRRRAVTLADAAFGPGAGVFEPLAFAVWDDDEFYFPHALRSVAWACECAPWCRPGKVWHLQKDFTLRRHRTSGAPDDLDRAYQSQWGFRRELYAGGLLWDNETYNEDQALARKLVAAGVEECDPCEAFLPYTIYDPYRAGDRLSRHGGAAGFNRGTPQPASKRFPARPPLPASVLYACSHPDLTRTWPRPWGPQSDWLGREVVR